MQRLVEDLEIAEADLSYPQTGGWPDCGEHIDADQKPQEVMMDELRQGANREVVAILTHFAQQRIYATRSRFFHFS